MGGSRRLPRLATASACRRLLPELFQPLKHPRCTGGEGVALGWGQRTVGHTFFHAASTPNAVPHQIPAQQHLRTHLRFLFSLGRKCPSVSRAPNSSPYAQRPSQLELATRQLIPTLLRNTHLSSAPSRAQRLSSIYRPSRSLSTSAAIAASPTGTTVTAPITALLSQAKHIGYCYFQLSKARLSLMVVATAGAGFLLGSGENVDWTHCAWTCAGTFLAAASANCFNQIIEVSNDAAMRRTMRRPLPSGRMSKGHALCAAIASGLGGVLLLLPQPVKREQTGAEPTNSRKGVEASASYLPATLAGANIALYAGVYTPLKRYHPINTAVGAVVGAIPPLIGWTAASGEGLWSSSRAAGAWLWAAVLYFWQLPHFMALAWMCREDYANGGYKMLSVADTTGRRTAAAALRNSVALLPLGALTYAYGVATAPFAVEASLLSAGMTAAAVPFYNAPSQASARRLFRMSLLYLPAYMVALSFHRIPHPAAAALSQSLPALGAQVSLSGLNHAEGAPAAEMSQTLQKVSVTLPPAAYVSAAPFPFLPLPQ